MKMNEYVVYLIDEFFDNAIFYYVKTKMNYEQFKTYCDETFDYYENIFFKNENNEFIAIDNTYVENEILYLNECIESLQNDVVMKCTIICDYKNFKKICYEYNE